LQLKNNCDQLSARSQKHHVAILCIGHVDEFYEKPMLEIERWTKATPLDEGVFDDYKEEQRRRIPA